MNEYVMESVLWLAPRKIKTDSATAHLIFTAVCDYYGVDEDDTYDEWDAVGFKSGVATLEINGKHKTITIKRI